MVGLSKYGCTALLVLATPLLSGCPLPPEAQRGSNLNLAVIVRTHPINLSPGTPGAPPPLPSEEELEQLCESKKNTVLFRVQSKEPGSSPTIIFGGDMDVTSLSDDENQADCRYDAGLNPDDGEYEVTVEVSDTAVGGVGEWTASCDIALTLPAAKFWPHNRAHFRMNKFAGTDEHQGCCLMSEPNEPQRFPPSC